LTSSEREELFIRITESALAYGVGFSTVDEIERVNILQATFLAMKRALGAITEEFDEVLVDGRDFPFGPDFKGEAIIKGDEKIPCIMAASILAKVTRDRYMIEMHEKYPVYQFCRHKGYPTKEHFELLKKYGPCEIHRKTFHGVTEFFIQ
jgi:ribonuclease HII